MSTFFNLLPGDTLLTTCVYNNPNPTVVKFGDSLTDEMCFAFLTYYPKIEVFQCGDLPEGLNGIVPFPPSCTLYPTLRPCNWTMPRTVCSNNLNVSETYYDEPDRGKPYLPYQSSRCSTTPIPSPSPSPSSPNHLLSILPLLGVIIIFISLWIMEV